MCHVSRREEMKQLNKYKKCLVEFVELFNLYIYIYIYIYYFLKLNIATQVSRLIQDDLRVTNMNIFLRNMSL
jgi:hypothetical protein